MTPHAFRRSRGRPGADPKCGACGRRQSDPVHVVAAPAAAGPVEEVGAMLRVADVRERYFPTVPEKRLREWIGRGELPAVKIGGMLFVPEAAVRKRIAEATAQNNVG